MVDHRFGLTHCTACWGGECKGGGVKQCLQRDLLPSRIAAILDSYGGMRTVVAHRKKLKHHVRHDELAILSPVRVHTPIAWDAIPGLIAHMQQVVGEWIAKNKPNAPHAVEAITMYRLRCLEQQQGALDLYSIVET